MKIAALQDSLAARIKRARVDANLQQQDLADAVGLTRTSISNIERGKQGLSVDLLYSISRRLNESADVLLRDAINYAEKHEAAALVKDRVPSGKGRDEILNIIKGGENEW